MASASQTVRTALEGSHLAIFLDIGTHSSGLLVLNAHAPERWAGGVELYRRRYSGMTSLFTVTARRPARSATSMT